VHSNLKYKSNKAPAVVEIPIIHKNRILTLTLYEARTLGLTFENLVILQQVTL